MTWLKLDDGFTRHPRMVAAGLHGRALFIAGLCYCGTHLTDGMIPKVAFPMLCAEAGVPARTPKVLIEVGSWIDKGDAIEVHDFLVYNPSRAKVLADRESAKQRMKSRRSSAEHAKKLAERSDAPSRPDPIGNSSTNGSNKSDPPAVDEEVEKVLDAYASLQRKRSPGITNHGNWRKAVITNARNEHGDTIRHWLDTYELTPDVLAAGLIDGPREYWDSRRKASA